MEIKRNGSRPSTKGSADYFTGTVRVDPLFGPPEPARAGGSSVTFEPGARTAWHAHPLGQTLIVTAGCGRVQREGGPVEEIRPGDVVWIPPGVKHWHGAAPTTAMTHIAIQEKLDGQVVEWMEKVTDEQYERSLPSDWYLDGKDMQKHKRSRAPPDHVACCHAARLLTKSHECYIRNHMKESRCGLRGVARCIALAVAT